MAKTLIGHARCDEKGNLKNGALGDNNGQEVRIQEWYSRPWNYVLRAKDDEMREKLASSMEAICKNDCFGYDQNKRNGIITQGEKVGYDFSKVTTKCGCDCSSAVTACLIASGIPKNVVFVNGNCSTTSVLRKRLESTKEFDVLTDKKYTGSCENLLRGDILLYEGHHVAINLTSAKTSVSVDNESTEYYPKYTGVSPSIINALKGVGENDVTFTHRTKIANANGITDYKGTAEQNLALVKLLKEGRLKKA